MERKTRIRNARIDPLAGLRRQLERVIAQKLWADETASTNESLEFLSKLTASIETLVLLANVVGLVRENVTDPQQRRAVLDDIRNVWESAQD